MILNSDWMLTKHFDDPEYQHYILMAAKQKFENKIDSGDLSSLYEVTFHAMNMNTLTSDNMLYDEHFNRHKKESVEKIHSEFNKGNMRIKAIAMEAKSVFAKIMSKYIDETIKWMANISITFSNKIIHTKESIYLVMHVTGTNIYDMWNLSLSPTNKLYASIQNVGSFEGGSYAITMKKFKAYVKEINKDKNKINESNIISVIMDNADDHYRVATIIKDIICFNKLFIGNAPINVAIIQNMRDMLINKDSFQYKLVY
jgi:hypothetical protein